MGVRPCWLTDRRVPPQPPSSPQHSRENLGSSQAGLTLQPSSSLWGQEDGAPVHPQIPVLAPPTATMRFSPGMWPQSLTPHLLRGRGRGEPRLGFPAPALHPCFGAGTPTADLPSPACLKDSGGTRPQSEEGWPHTEWGRWYRASVSPARGGAVGLRSSRNPQPKQHSAASREGINTH